MEGGGIAEDAVIGLLDDTSKPPRNFSFHRDRRRSIANNDGSDREVGRLCPGAEAHDCSRSGDAQFFRRHALGNGDIGLCLTVRPDALGLHLGKEDSWDIRVSEDHYPHVLRFKELLKLWERASEEAKREGKPEMIYLEEKIGFFREYTEKVTASIARVGRARGHAALFGCIVNSTRDASDATNAGCGERIVPAGTCERDRPGQSFLFRQYKIRPCVFCSPTGRLRFRRSITIRI